MIINLTHQKGGVGKSTIATNLAVALDAIIIDLDTQRSSVLWNKIRQSNGYTPLECLTVANETEMKQVLKNNAGRHVVIDSGGYDSGMTRLAIIAADIILTPVAPSQVEIFGLQNFTKILQQISDEIGQTIQTNVLINNADIRSKTAIQSLQQYVTQNHTYLNLLNSITHFRADFKKAYGMGLSVVEMDPRCKAAAEIEQLSSEILD
ncbi:MAG: plasmid partitioning protein [Bacteroidetes bacterium]|nr:plasmid partitioning protein [Bacteroidota bacterium]